MIKQGIIFDISRFCLNDGPGIRTTVFFKGCPLRCQWCHNPESQNIYPEIMYSQEQCVTCGKCLDVCPHSCHSIKEKHIFDRNSCVKCGSCVQNCPVGALRLTGRYCTAEKIIGEVIRDKIYYEESGGGLTVSGGEPLMQIDFLESLLKIAKKEGIHTCIETCGYAPRETIEKIAPLTDCFLFDWKESNPDKHRLFTGVDNKLICENLYYLNKVGAEIILRLPLIPGYNDTEEHLEGIALLANHNTSIKCIEIMPYHPLGISKAYELGREKNKELPDIPDKNLLDNFLSQLCKKVSVSVTLSV